MWGAASLMAASHGCAAWHAITQSMSREARYQPDACRKPCARQNAGNDWSAADVQACPQQASAALHGHVCLHPLLPCRHLSKTFLHT